MNIKEKTFDSELDKMIAEVINETIERETRLDGLLFNR